MSCKNVCRLCRNLIISTAVVFDPTTNSLDITIPDNGYRNCEKVCIIVAQTIPTSTTINALVNIVINGTRFPLQRCNCTQATACEIRTRTKYSTKVVTNTISGAFRLLGRTIACCPESLETLPVSDAVTPAVASVDTPVVAAFSGLKPTKSTTKKEVAVNE